MSFYAEQARRSKLLLGGRFGQGGIELLRKVTIPPDEPWEDPTVTTTATPLQAVKRGVEVELVGQQNGPGGPVVGAGAMHVTAVPPDGGWAGGDSIRIDGKAYLILKAEPVGDPAAPAFIKFLVQA